MFGFGGGGKNDDEKVRWLTTDAARYEEKVFRMSSEAISLNRQLAHASFMALIARACMYSLAARVVNPVSAPPKVNESPINHRKSSNQMRAKKPRADCLGGLAARCPTAPNTPKRKNLTKERRRCLSWDSEHRLAVLAFLHSRTTLTHALNRCRGQAGRKSVRKGGGASKIVRGSSSAHASASNLMANMMEYRCFRAIFHMFYRALLRKQLTMSRADRPRLESNSRRQRLTSRCPMSLSLLARSARSSKVICMHKTGAWVEQKYD